MKWLKRLFNICEHDWEIIRRIDLELCNEGNPVGHKYIEIMRCQKCGKIWKQEIKY